jgi:cobalt/nickel transport system permease protein
VLGGIGGALAVFMTALVMAMSLMLSGDEFVVAAQLTLLSHLPVMLVEGLLTGAAVYLVARVRPELFNVLAMAGVPARVSF